MPKTKMQFTIKGKAISPRYCLPVKRAREILDAMKFGHLMFSVGLAEELGVTVGSFRAYSAHPSLNNYKAIHRGQALVWGSKKTIKAYREDKNAKDDNR